MNRDFTLSLTWLRAVFAAASVVVTVAVIGAIGALAAHYEAEAQLSHARTTAVASR